MNAPFYTLGIETSCDETAVAVLEGEHEILNNSVYSQAEIHADYGGVVPEVASRDHLRKLPLLVAKSLQDVNITMQQLSLVAATYGPGLVGPLLVGLSYGKGLSFGLNVPFIGVNHLEGHLFANRVSGLDIERPFMGLIVSGGHTNLVVVNDYGDYSFVGATVDDAAGEALDKVGKMLGIEYPAGAEIDQMASEGNPKAIRFPRPMQSSGGFNFSFSGLKTSVMYHLKKNSDERAEDVAASFLASMIDVLANKALAATRRYHLDRLVVVGGVAANSHLRRRIAEQGEEMGIEAFFPPPSLCTDNAAMIAVAGAFRYLQVGETHELSLEPNPSLTL